MNTIQNAMPSPPGQEEWRFVDDLRKPLPRRVHWRPDRQPNAGELNLQAGVDFKGGFNDPQGWLTTAEDELRRFLHDTGIARNHGIPLTTEQTDGLAAGGFRLDTSPSGIRILAGDTEGIRRGIGYLEERLMGADAPSLPLGVVERQPWLRNRISRCFFGPIKRPPFNRDELMDEVDYYPDAYLDQLAHEGVNGLWLTIVFRDLCRTSLIEANPDAGKRLAKLRRTVDKCLRYGIKTWVFCIEPAGFGTGDSLLEKYPELRGARDGAGGYCFCPGSDLADRYLYESTHGLFSQVPGLGGLINISYGERPTTCLSSIQGAYLDPVDCPRCGPLPPWRILHRSLGAMQRGMRAANPSAELISWFYMPHASTHPDWMADMAGHMPEGVVLQYNFESGGLKTQMGRPRVGGDYWLSYIGPSGNFARIADRAVHAGTPLSAKLQVGCSHEVASIPFVPVPGLLYRKFKQMRQLGCAHVMQCWYFGNYPGVMNRAAGALAYETFDDSEDAFLLRLARPDWGAAADIVVTAWRHLTEGYTHYPLANLFQYYGPMHDGVVWPLFLLPALKPLAPTWLTARYPSGDTIGECLDGFSLPEALALCDKMADQWQQGADLFLSLRPRFRDNPERLRDIGLVEALGIQFKSGRNILRFHHLRALLIHARAANPLQVLAAMQRLVDDEITHSERMLELCEQDSRLGFHSESETYKYYPAKLRWRIDRLRHLLATEFPETRRRLESGGRMPEWAPGRPAYRWGQGWVQGAHFRWRLDEQDGDLVFHAECQAPVKRDYSIIDFYLIDKAGIQHPWRFRCSPEISAEDSAIINGSWGDMLYGERTDTQWSVAIVVPGLSWDMDPAKKPAYVSVTYTLIAPGAPPIEESWPPVPSPRLSRLALCTFDPEHMARLED